jgi:hypothetical protein
VDDDIGGGQRRVWTWEKGLACCLGLGGIIGCFKGCFKVNFLVIDSCPNSAPTLPQFIPKREFWINWDKLGQSWDDRKVNFETP